MKKIIAIVMISCLYLGLVGCAQPISSSTYSGNEAGAVSQVKRGVIISMRPVNIDNNSGAGGVVGSIGGAAAGSTIGGSTAGHILGAVGGAVVGGLVGNAVDKGINNHQGYEYIIRLRNGRTVAVVQDASVVFGLHQRVMIIYGSRTRLVPDHG